MTSNTKQNRIGRALQCKHCGYLWHARTPRTPLTCPNHCKCQWFWNVDYEDLPEHLKKHSLKLQKAFLETKDPEIVDERERWIEQRLARYSRKKERIA